MKSIGVATYFALLVGASASHAQTEDPVQFELKGSEPTTLEECMEAMEIGTVMPGLTKTMGEDGTFFVVVYEGSMFSFFLQPETKSLCNKQTPKALTR